MTNWHVGMKVVCINPGEWTDSLTNGDIYTISRVTPDDMNMIVWLGLIELPPTATDRMGWSSSRFRPLIKTDISIFEAMLVPTKNDIRILGSNWPDCLTEEVRQFFEEVRQNVST